MPRRRQRHFNPATAGLHCVMDARFGVTLIGSDLSRWVGRSGTIYNGTTYGYPGTPTQSPTVGSINGQKSLTFTDDYVFVSVNNDTNYPGWYLLQSFFTVAKVNTPTNAGSPYQRIASSIVTDVDAFIGCAYSASSPNTRVATFMGVSGTWFDTNPNTPAVDLTVPVAMCVRRPDYDGAQYPMSATSSTTIQNDKTGNTHNVALALIGAGISGVSPQFFKGDIGMIAFGATTGLPMDRRILQMMGRVWRIHTL